MKQSSLNHKTQIQRGRGIEDYSRQRGCQQGDFIMWKTGKFGYFNFFDSSVALIFQKAIIHCRDLDDIAGKSNDIIKYFLKLQIPAVLVWGGWGCAVSCGGHHRRDHRPRGKTTTGSALDGAVFDIAEILAYLVHNMSRSQLYLGFGHFGCFPYFFRSITFWRT